ncbi:ATP-dependent DNA helicase [uncultured Anaerococcus sp.]|uniref:ATP-dependent DNA helicase n=1 Tax=uncultured Anaerococcus sp. TaxID=293428 RepID=UPI00262A342A|nr:ATP-dependent DNA helicase [uncultured Anaerococcus sp.]
MINESQRIIVERAKTPAAVIAGPGTGKTYTIVKKVISLIKNESLSPNRILITTFTKKAARELQTRIISEFNRQGIKTELKDMMIGNFHSLALDFLEKYPSLDRPFLDAKVIDQVVEGYLIEENLESYKSIEGYEKYITYNHAKEIKGIYEEITNKLLDVEALLASDDPREVFAGKIFTSHEKLLKEKNLINFQMILRDFYKVLKDPVLGEEIRSGIDFVIVDEYQDTNYIQQEIAFNLVRDKEIMVFGDDDQSLYSFRGADPRNLTEFSDKFFKAKGHKAFTYKLDINYRSNQVIIDKSLKWLDNKDYGVTKKSLRSVDRDKNPNTIVRARAYEYKNLTTILRILKQDINLGQIAFLFPSLNHAYVSKLQSCFEKAGIRVLNKKSSQFFKRDEIRGFIYLIMKIGEIKTYYEDPSTIYGTFGKNKAKYKNYLYYLDKDETLKEDLDLQKFIEDEKESPLLITNLLYKAMGLDYFRKFLIMDEKDLDGARVLGNISTIINLAKDFDEIFINKNLKDHYKDFVNSYLQYLFVSRSIEEYANIDSHKDAVNFMTIHQAKGLEFEVVFISGLYDSPKPSKPKFLEKRDPNDFSYVKDFYRKYYTGFTRAKNLLVLLDNSEDYKLNNFSESFPRSSAIKSLAFARDEEKKEKLTLAYTTDIEVFKTCSLKYRFMRKLDFKTLKTPALSFGTNTHKLSEYISLRPDDIGSLKEFLEKNPAYKKPLENFINRDFQIKGIETNYKLDRNFYILQGKVDLSLADGSIVDIKTGSYNKELIEGYKGQLMTYRQLILGNKHELNKMFLYFIEEDRLIEISPTDFDINEIDKIARMIDRNIGYRRTDDTRACKYCQMRYFCKRN